MMLSHLRILVPLCVRLPTAAGAHTYSRRPRSSRPPAVVRRRCGETREESYRRRHLSRGRETRPGRPLCRFKSMNARPAKTPPPEKVAEGIAAATVLK